jgi:hypothetical protein
MCVLAIVALIVIVGLEVLLVRQVFRQRRARKARAERNRQFLNDVPRITTESSRGAVPIGHA